MPLIKFPNNKALITPKQLTYIEQLFIDVLKEDAYKRVKRLGLVSWAGISRKVNSIDELTISEASTVIDYLKSLKEQEK